MNKTQLLCAALTLSVTASVSQAETVKLSMSSWLPPTHPLVTDVFKPWIEDVKQATDGRIEIVMLPSPLGHPKAHFDLARDGQADITYSTHGFNPGRFKLTEMFELPFSGDSAETTSVATWEVYNKYFAKAGEHRGVQLLSLFTNGPGQIHTSNKPIKAMTDFGGMKLRVAGGAAQDIVEVLGGVPLHKPVSSTFELMSNGVADGTLFPVESVSSFKLQDVATHTTLIPGGLFNTTLFLAMNKDRFDSLTVDDQKTLMDMSGTAFAKRAGQMFDAQDARVLSELKANGNDINVADPDFVASIRTSTMQITTAWVEEAKNKGVDAEAALAEYQKRVH